MSLQDGRWLAWGLFAVRVLMGAFFLYEAMNQLTGGWIGGDGLERMLRSALNDNSIPAPYRRFLEDVVIARHAQFTILIIASEVAIGVALILGLLTRLTALVALSMNANFLLLNSPFTAGGAIDIVFIVLEIALIAWAPRQALSLDGLLARGRSPALF